jgi:hypothetical protein
MIRGEELRRFLSERTARRKRPTPPGMIFCLRCREPRRPALDMVDYVPLSSTFGNLQGICPVCVALLFRRVNLAKLQAVAVGLAVTVRPGELKETFLMSFMRDIEFRLTEGPTDIEKETRRFRRRSAG